MAVELVPEIGRRTAVITQDYLSELCMPVTQVAERQHLRSASRNLLVAPRFQLNTYGRRAFAVARRGCASNLELTVG